MVEQQTFNLRVAGSNPAGLTIPPHRRTALQAIDTALLGTLMAAARESPMLRSAARWITELGGSAWLVPVTLGICAWLIARRRLRHAVALLLVTLAGRLFVEAMKLSIGRSRPDLTGNDIIVHSLSFPSGHAANSMIVYLGIALIAFKRPYRRTVAGAALLMSFIVGLTRPLLGVHWPSDVLAGWALGLAWTLSFFWLLSRWLEGRPVSRPPLSN